MRQRGNVEQRSSRVEEGTVPTIKCNSSGRLCFPCLIDSTVSKDEKNWAIAFRCDISREAVLTLGNLQNNQGLALRRHGKNNLNSVSESMYLTLPQACLQYHPSHERVAWIDTKVGPVQ